MLASVAGTDDRGAVDKEHRLRLMILADAASAHTVRWVQALAGRGHEILLFTLMPPPAEVYEDLTNVSVVWPGIGADIARISEGALGKLRYLRALPLLLAQARCWKPDLVHAHYASSYGLLATLARVRPRIVSVWGMDVFSFPRRSDLHRRLMRWVLGSADAVLSTSHVMRERVYELVDRSVVVTPFGIDTHRFCPPSVPRSPDCLCVGTVKALEEKYGIDYLLRAFAIVLQKGVHPVGYRLLIVGGGSCRDQLERLAMDLGIIDKVQFIGACVYADVHLWHQALDVAVYPSIDPSESFGVAAVESQSCGVPVVVSRIGGLPEVVVDKVTGTVVAPRDADALAAAILEILDDPALRRRMGESGRRHVVDVYSIETCVEVMEKVYAGAVARGAGKPASATHGDRIG